MNENDIDPQEYMVMYGSNSSGRTSNAISEVLDAIGKGESVVVSCDDSKLEKLLAAGIPRQNILTNSQMAKYRERNDPDWV